MPLLSKYDKFILVRNLFYKCEQQLEKSWKESEETFPICQSACER